MAEVTRICLTGPESTGKTGLAAALGDELGTVWVPEYAREYAERHGNELSAADVEPIARGQMANEDRVSANGILLLDTDLLSTVVYARHYYGSCPEWIEREARRRKAHLYLLLDTDVPWKADPARDAGGEVREDLFDAFRAALDEFDTRWQIMSGEWETRKREALRHVRLFHGQQ
jgi:NadR type nicotinamide-nucleotide adenylyltransferase